MMSQNFINNRAHMSKHPSQGLFKKVLCVCSGGLLRSPTAAVVLSQKPYNFNTRAAGLIPKYALIQVNQLLIDWADEIVCMDFKHKELINKFVVKNKKITCLGITDDFVYMDPKLVKLIKEKYEG